MGISQDATPVTNRQRHRSRRDITHAGLAVFARDGYSRASIDAIAREAEVSTRTIYNHFTDKAELFATVIEESATHTADAQIEMVRHHLGDVTDLERALHDFGRVWARPHPEFADHFALVRQINADVEHIPAASLEAWQQAGPLRVRREIAAHLARLAEYRLLTIDNPDRAAMHLVALTTAEVTQRSTYGARPLDDREIIEIADTGVDVFLRAYRT